MIERMEMQTKDLSQEKIRMLGELFPDCITESKEGDKVVLSVDFDALRQDLSDHVVEGPKERYQFTWPDKNKARVLANTPTTNTLRPCREESVDFDTTKNLYIEGDNLEVLKILRETYLGKVKMIYIDPPYNTGNDFVYKDDFTADTHGFLYLNGEISDSGERLVINSNTDGRFHTNWLNMMYPRLLLSKDFLTDDGVIFISINNQEIATLKMIMDEIFGYHNFIGIIDWESKTKCQNTKTAKKQLQNKQEYILVYKKKSQRYEFNLRVVATRKYPDKDDKGNYRLEQIGEMSASGMRARESMVFPINGIMPKEGNQWKIGKSTVDAYINRGDIIVKNGRVFLKIRSIDEDEQTEPFWSFIPKEIGTAESANSELKKLIGDNGFETVKPVNLIKKLIFHSTSDDDIVMDFFAGTSTTAHAVMDLNNEMSSHRVFISIQLPEKCGENSDSKKAGYDYITDIGKKRLKTVIKNLKSAFVYNQDLGYRVFKLDSSNMNAVYFDPKSVLQRDLVNFRDKVKFDRNEDDLLIQSMLEFGIELSAKIEKEYIENIPILIIDNGYLVACLSDKCSESVITSIAKMEVKPVYAVIRNGVEMTDQLLSNIEQIFKTYSPDTTIRLI